jgi:hypothetical protein
LALFSFIIVFAMYTVVFHSRPSVVFAHALTDPHRPTRAYCKNVKKGSKGIETKKTLKINNHARREKRCFKRKKQQVIIWMAKKTKKTRTVMKDGAFPVWRRNYTGPLNYNHNL